MERLKVLKTYKVYIGGKFPRTESGRYYSPKNAKGEVLGNICFCSRKDIRNSVVAARKAFGGWSERAANNRGQILYRIAEMLEGRKAQFIEELILQGSTKVQAEKEVVLSIDRLIYYAGWCDKYTQVLGSVNPVASSHFNFSMHVPTGVVGILAVGNLSDRFGRKRLLVFCLVVAPIAMLLFTATTGWLQLLLLLVVGVSLLSTTPVMLAMVQEYSVNGSSAANGVFMMISFLARSAVVVLVGFVADIVGLEKTFVICGLIGFTGIPFVLRIKSAPKGEGI